MLSWETATATAVVTVIIIIIIIIITKIQDRHSPSSIALGRIVCDEPCFQWDTFYSAKCVLFFKYFVHYFVTIAPSRGGSVNMLSMVGHIFNSKKKTI